MDNLDPTENSYLCEVINTNPHINTSDIIEVLENVFDPDIHYSVYDIGLIYKVTVDLASLNVIMTLTSVNCPEAQTLPEQIKEDLTEKFPELNINVEITFEPAWTIDNMSEEIKLSLGLL